LVFPSKENSFTLYEDDGISYDYKEGKYSLTGFSVDKNDSEIKLAAKKTVDKYKPGRKSFLINFFNVSTVKEVKTDGKQLTAVSSKDELQKSKSGYYFDSKENSVITKIPAGNEFEVVVKLKD
jgi:alpha-glucosidase